MWAHQAVAAPPATGYSMGKAALHALTRNLAMELAEHKIRVNAVAPPPCMRRSYPGTSSRPRSTPSTASTRSAVWERPRALPLR